MEQGVPAGETVIEFKYLRRWSKPDAQTVAIVSGQTTQATGVYTQPTRARIVNPQPGQRIKEDHVRVTAELAKGAGDKVSQVLIQFRSASGGEWQEIPAGSSDRRANSGKPPQWSGEWDVESLTPGAYNLRAVAYDPNGQPDPSPPSITVRVLAGDDKKDK